MSEEKKALALLLVGMGAAIFAQMFISISVVNDVREIESRLDAAGIPEVTK